MSAPTARASQSSCLALLGPVYPFRGGIAQHTILLAKALEEAGASLSIFSFQRLYPNFLYPGESDRDPSQQALKTNADFSLDSINPVSWLQTGRKIAGARPQRVIIPWWTTFLAPAIGSITRLLNRRGIPTLYLVHNVLPHEPGWWDRPLGRWALAPGRGYVVQSERERARLHALLPDVQPVVCPHPIYNQFDGQHLDQSEARRKLGLPEDGRLLLFFGFIRPYKGLSVLLDALAGLLAQGETVSLLVAGEFWKQEAEIRARIQELGLLNSVVLHDQYIPDEEIPLIFSAADLFVAPYLHGTQSGALKMALGFGLPAVITDAISEELPPDFQQQITVVPAGNAAALVGGIRSALSNYRISTQQMDSRSGWAELARTVLSIPL